MRFLIISCFLLVTGLRFVTCEEEDDGSFADDLYVRVYRRCWSDCVEKAAPLEDPFVSMMQAKFDLDRHKSFCRAYNGTRSCAVGCLSHEDHDVYLRPFFRRNILNEFVCHKHYNDIHEFLPCYLRSRTFETTFQSCGKFVFEDEVRANRETCSSLRCVTQTLPGLVRQKCVADDNEQFGGAAAALFEKMLGAFLRQRIPFRILLVVSISSAFNKDSIEDCSRVFSEHAKELFEKITQEQKIRQNYEKLVEEEQFDPRDELKKSKVRIEKYLRLRAQFAYKAKVSLESRGIRNASDAEVNDPSSKEFIRFMSAKQGNDGTTIYENNHLGRRTRVNETRIFNLTQNANFYTLATSSIASAVHVPTPLYDRNADLLRKIDWSNVDAVYRTNREEIRDLAFQMFCSESGYMRFYPAASWFWDNEEEHLDLFDCRNTEWYINAATNSKNVLIMLDMSGSMLGQRYEVAKQTTEAILETLSHNDYFNIMPFSKSPYFLDECNGENGLLQATMRNKKALRQKMNNISSEGKADYEKALPQAFSTLLNLKGSYSLHTREEMALMATNGSAAAAHHTVHVMLPEHVLTASQEYIDSITKGGSGGRAACESVIMLITDGAPNAYSAIFELYNKNKRVRVFTFLVGDEAIDFNEVREMACQNRGYMVHVANMADVDEKVQHYIRRMSRAVGKHNKEISEEDALWTGVYRERLYLPRPEVFAEPVPITNQSFAVMNKMAARRKIRLHKSEARGRMFVTTVSFPVVVNESFMGVAAVNIPLTEVNQKAHPSNIGAKSYFFMLDQNGFVMSHPQLRPIDLDTKQHKQNYNNMDILELEVSQTQQVRKMVIDCDNSDIQQLDVIFATEILNRVYPQTNSYYAECIDQANFVLGLAVAKGDDYRLVSKNKKYDFKKVTMDWIADKQWRIHPHWRYCLLNDTDTNVSKEEAFTVYVEQMAKTGAVPLLCQPRQHLVEKALVDLEATSSLVDLWDTQFQFMKDSLVHLVFFGTPSGVIRYYNLTLDDYDYIDPYWSIFDHIGSILSIEHVQESYNHFITDLNRKTSDDRYYRRAVRMKDTILFDVSANSKIWYKSELQNTGYGLNENLTMLGQMFKAVHMQNAILGVAGFEFAYDFVVDTMSEHGCAPTDGRRWCVLLDEHGYVFYSNWPEISYEKYLANEGKHINQFFGRINRIAQRTMALLVENKFYTKLMYTDHQSSCKIIKTVVTSASRNTPFNLLRSFVMNVINVALNFFYNFGLLSSTKEYAEAYTASFHEGNDGYPCSKTSPFYFSNKDGRNRPQSTWLVASHRSERPCKKNSKCSVKMEASFVEHTNLVMVWITQDKVSENCYEESHCPLEDPSEVPFGFEENPHMSGECDEAPPKERASKSSEMCYSIDDDNGTVPCSFALSKTTWLLPLAALSFLLL
ncbi:unnamed protein product [Caenorhabditis auriculariae]|uniref:VWFA domain-containing protein n=1 Tax=Caenorhabditis auriculariae TaxID=2777116 RepID=A0A8S1H4F3_9PELO|nr:unnamed protein product [Caenorhabditis auriculariae]